LTWIDLSPVKTKILSKYFSFLFPAVYVEVSHIILSHISNIYIILRLSRLSLCWLVCIEKGGGWDFVSVFFNPPEDPEYGDAGAVLHRPVASPAKEAARNAV